MVQGEVSFLLSRSRLWAGPLVWGSPAFAVSPVHTRPNPSDLAEQSQSQSQNQSSPPARRSGLITRSTSAASPEVLLLSP